MPAALCGVVGLKPSFGRIPHSGSIGYSLELDSWNGWDTSRYG
ncbi:Amidase [Cynara cardunculus var. scolymus]|uniref:Amidase n=1 Tax=Cynara cardunculus var. scolymus TaxID=59895 RepID=A0A103XB23_CYNCS|nr:Amidase [Cynara cardunculus var. scolymus]